MTQVTQLVITPPLMRQARNLQLAIIDLAKKRDLTPEQLRDRLHAIDMLVREAHDTIVDAEFEQEDKGRNGEVFEMSKELPTVVAENYMTIAPDLTIKVVVLSNGQRVIPEEDMKRACEWLGIDLSSLEAESLFQEQGNEKTNR